MAKESAGGHGHLLLRRRYVHRFTHKMISDPSSPLVRPVLISRENRRRVPSIQPEARRAVKTEHVFNSRSFLLCVRKERDSKMLKEKIVHDIHRVESFQNSRAIQAPRGVRRQSGTTD